MGQNEDALGSGLNGGLGAEEAMKFTLVTLSTGYKCDHMRTGDPGRAAYLGVKCPKCNNEFSPRIERAMCPKCGFEEIA